MAKHLTRYKTRYGPATDPLHLSQDTGQNALPINIDNTMRREAIFDSGKRLTMSRGSRDLERSLDAV
jgi:hypothetical protein